jgi:hypothetical protein
MWPGLECVITCDTGPVFVDICYMIGPTREVNPLVVVWGLGVRAHC